MSRSYRAKKPKTDKIHITPQELKEIKTKVTEAAINKVTMLYLGTLAERGWSDDELVDIFFNC